ncbi:hypothetical protein TNCV_2743691 [Trichonephila clavipes]|nr:hypothetical protein TNCV_2743691 [Trichonephila clavipes]
MEDNIRRVIADIRPQMLEKVIENWMSRLDYIRASRGSPMLEVIFKIEGILMSHSLSSLLNYLRAFGDRPVAGVPGGQGIESWLACLEFEPSATKDPPCVRKAVGSLVVIASDSRPEVLGSMLDVTKYPPSAHGFTCRNCGGGDRGRVAIYRPFGEFHRAQNALSPVWCSKPTTSVPLAHATMNFMGLVLTTSDSARALVPQKLSIEEELMHVKHVEVKSPHVGVMWKFGRGVISSGIVLVT